MNPCEYLNDLGPYLDGELDPRRRLALEAHLSGCGSGCGDSGCCDCRTELGQLRALSGVLADAPQPAMPAQAPRRLHGRVNDWMGEAARAEREVERAERRVLRITRMLTGVAACVLVAGSLWLVQSRRAVSPPSHPLTVARLPDSWEGSALSVSVTGGGEAASAADGSVELLPGGLVNPLVNPAVVPTEATDPVSPVSPVTPGGSGNTGTE